MLAVWFDFNAFYDPFVFKAENDSEFLFGSSLGLGYLLVMGDLDDNGQPVSVTGTIVNIRIFCNVDTL